MAIAVEQRILEELEVVKTKVIEMDNELHRLREDFDDTHMSGEERRILAEALEEESQGKTISLENVKKRFS